MVDLRKCKFRERFKSWQLWVACAALIIYVVKTIFKVDISEELNGLLDVLCPILIAFGIINDPNSSKIL